MEKNEIRLGDVLIPINSEMSPHHVYYWDGKKLGLKWKGLGGKLHEGMIVPLAQHNLTMYRNITQVTRRKIELWKKMK